MHAQEMDRPELENVPANVAVETLKANPLFSAGLV